VFTITSYSAFRRTTAESFAEAVEAADRFAREGNLPSTIAGLGSRWTKWAGALVELAEGPGLTDRDEVRRRSMNQAAAARAAGLTVWGA
jgi:hypothetical protein